MDELLLRAASHAVSIIEQLYTLSNTQGTVAARTSVSMAVGFAMRSVTKYIENAPRKARSELESVKITLESKIRVVQPSIDLIEIIAARGNTSLESVLVLTNSLRREIDAFAKNIANEGHDKMSQNEVLRSMKALLVRIEDAVPLLNLSLTVSGASLGSNMSSWVSPSRLMLASSHLVKADEEWDACHRLQVGPPFEMKLYTLFGASIRKDDANGFTWKEEFAKCRACLYRMTAEDDQDTPFTYELELWEDINDGRYHEELAAKKNLEGFQPGISKRIIPVHQITRIFFSASGQLLAIEDAHTPVLVLKVVKSMPLPTRLKHRSNAGTPTQQDTSTVEWLALEVLQDDPDAEGTSADETPSDTEGEQADADADADVDSDDGDSSGDEVTAQLTRLSIEGAKLITPTRSQSQSTGPTWNPISPAPDLASLSTLEYMLRLCACRMTEQSNHVNVQDERLNVFLQDDQDVRGSEARKQRERPGSARSSRRNTPRSTPIPDTPTPAQKISPLEKRPDKASRLAWIGKSEET